jgi:hypothetical protein
MAANLTPRGEAILRTARAFFAALDDFRAKSADEARLITAFVISHVRSSDASVMLPSVELPVVASPVVASPVVVPAVEPVSRVRRDLVDGAWYEFWSRGIEAGQPVPIIGARIEDPFADVVTLALTDDQAEQLQADIAAVRAGAKR